MKLQQLPQGCSFNRPKAPAVMIVKQFLGFFRAEALDHTYNVLRLTLYVNRYWRAGLEQVFRLLYCFFVIEHERRRILHFNVTRHPTAEWVVQQLREAFPEAGPYRYAILDHDAKFDADVIAFLKATGLEPKRTSVQAP